MTCEEAERVVEEQATLFVEAKDYLIQAWDNPRQCSTEFLHATENL
jgi:uncharacterized protein (DUF1778 family)